MNTTRNGAQFLKQNIISAVDIHKCKKLNRRLSTFVRPRGDKINSRNLIVSGRHCDPGARRNKSDLTERLHKLQRTKRIVTHSMDVTQCCVTPSANNHTAFCFVNKTTGE